ncbi:hypothetical protein S40288_11360 [Stachybotrys chartarum IBT 40288]|nr:hypothetical protein S40288_11360 [Stachybotrys chartarum IBT 40288]
MDQQNTPFLYMPNLPGLSLGGQVWSHDEVRLLAPDRGDANFAIYHVYPNLGAFFHLLIKYKKFKSHHLFWSRVAGDAGFSAGADQGLIISVSDKIVDARARHLAIPGRRPLVTGLTLLVDEYVREKSEVFDLKQSRKQREVKKWTKAREVWSKEKEAFKAGFVKELPSIIPQVISYVPPRPPTDSGDHAGITRGDETEADLSPGSRVVPFTLDLGDDIQHASAPSRIKADPDQSKEELELDHQSRAFSENSSVNSVANELSMKARLLQQDARIVALETLFLTNQLSLVRQVQDLRHVLRAVCDKFNTLSWQVSGMQAGEPLGGETGSLRDPISRQ